MLISRRKPITSPVMLALIASIVPLIAALYLTRRRELNRAQESLNTSVEQGGRALDQLLAAADIALRQTAEETKGGVKPEWVTQLQQVVFRSPYFRECGLIDQAGNLVLTNHGPVVPPRAVARGAGGVGGGGAGTDSAGTGMQIRASPNTWLTGESSLVLAMPTGGEGEVYVVVDPSLVRTMIGGGATDTNKGGTTALLAPTGKVMFTVGAGTSDTDEESAKGLNARYTSERFGTSIIARVPRAWALRSWTDDALILAPLGLVCCGGVAILVGRLARRHHGLEDELRQALANNEFEAHYQPTMETRTRRCIGAEVLLRWKHPHSGYIRPDLFVAAAEASGLIEAITIQLMHNVVRDVGQVMRRHPHLHLGINLTPAHFNKRDLHIGLRAIFNESTIPPARILLEATERSAMDGAAVREVMNELRGAGFSVALDDFGTGYSSLSYLHTFKFDYLKIDASFVRRIGADQMSTGLLDAIIELGNTLNVRLIAEGVETEAQLQYLVKKDVPYAQGWFFSKALPAAEFKAFISSHMQPATAMGLSSEPGV